MTKRIIAALCLVLALILPARADEEVVVHLNPTDSITFSRNFGFAIVSFDLLSHVGDDATVRIAVENVMQEGALLLFGGDYNEEQLNVIKPKFEFDKIFPGKKGSRYVSAYKKTYKLVEIIPASQKDTVSIVKVSTRTPEVVSMPFYIAKYKPSELLKKGVQNTKFKIARKETIEFKIYVTGWTPENPLYQETKAKVDTFVNDFNNTLFCTNKKHKPNAKDEVARFERRRQELLAEIEDILVENDQWLSTDRPHQAYTALKKELESIDLSSRNTDCGKHKADSVPSQPKPTPATTTTQSGHSCAYCSSSAAQLFHSIDDTYQQMRAGKITKEQAKTRATAIVNCYNKNSKRGKDSFYGGKITNYYNRILK